ncbi:chitin synthase-domain-containing protein [Cladochytrium replicatum]|nr:chitin synthase-domain-containing protein [Cladochytrium replicatum]
MHRKGYDHVHPNPPHPPRPSRPLPIPPTEPPSMISEPPSPPSAFHDGPHYTEFHHSRNPNRSPGNLSRSSSALRRQRSLTRSDRGSRRTPRPLVRKPSRGPPLARTGATSNFQHETGPGSNLPMPEVLNAYTIPEVVDERSNWWIVTSRTLTCCCFPIFLSWCGKRDSQVQQAWREKVALCLIILMIMTCVGFLTLGLKPAFCPDSIAEESEPYFVNSTKSPPFTVPYREDVIIGGLVYDFNQTNVILQNYTNGSIVLNADWYGADLTTLFVPPSCWPYYNGTYNCTIPNKFPGSPPLTPAVGQPCPDRSWLRDLKPKRKLFLYWDEVERATISPYVVIIFNGKALNLENYLKNRTSLDGVLPLRQVFNPNTSDVDAELNQHIGRDATLGMYTSWGKIGAIRCLQDLHTIGLVDDQSPGCFGVQIINGVALVVILGVVLSRFVMALVFHWMLSVKLTDNANASGTNSSRPARSLPPHLAPYLLNSVLQEKGLDTLKLGGGGGHNGTMDRSESSVMIPSRWQEMVGPGEYSRDSQSYVILMVTCYSEGEHGIRNTLDSLAGTDYPDDQKLLFVICDGIINGSGNDRSTPDIVVDMIVQDPTIPAPEPRSYLAIADGAKQHNMAKVYVGHYIHIGRAIPIVVLVKCGPPEESTQKKPGNRGKRDSQLVVMNFLSRVMFNDRMTPLDFELFTSIHHVCGVTADRYELILMVDADTKVEYDALMYMVRAMQKDEQIMGLCGETRIANKRDSWVTAIQVFEYYISHHLGKAFESIFGGVTCLPGCFSMYRIKARKGPTGNSVPILVNPDIVDEYSESIVDTLHKKNLLLLGEDRFLTTLMLRAFPKRKMVFVPQALCRTVVPDEFRVLLSQRRRWINSTIHNLLELVLIRDLCGTFCFSMQFVIALELIGTVVLPAALLFMIILLVSVMATGASSTLPLLMLAATLGLPGALIVVTSRKWIYVGWMFIYLLALPIWNFVLPVYAFWHFDDFSWGETRKVEGETRQDVHGQREGEYEVGSVILKKWEDWEYERRLELHTALAIIDERVPQGRGSPTPITKWRFFSDPSPMDGPESGRFPAVAAAAEHHNASYDSIVPAAQGGGSRPPLPPKLITASPMDFMHLNVRSNLRLSLESDGTSIPSMSLTTSLAGSIQPSPSRQRNSTLLHHGHGSGYLLTPQRLAGALRPTASPSTMRVDFMMSRVRSQLPPIPQSPAKQEEVPPVPERPDSLVPNTGSVQNAAGPGNVAASAKVLAPVEIVVHEKKPLNVPSPGTRKLLRQNGAIIADALRQIHNPVSHPSDSNASGSRAAAVSDDTGTDSSISDHGHLSDEMLSVIDVINARKAGNGETEIKGKEPLERVQATSSTAQQSQSKIPRKNIQPPPLPDPKKKSDREPVSKKPAPKAAKAVAPGILLTSKLKEPRVAEPESLTLVAQQSSAMDEVSAKDPVVLSENAKVRGAASKTKREELAPPRKSTESVGSFITVHRFWGGHGAKAPEGGGNAAGVRKTWFVQGKTRADQKDKVNEAGHEGPSMEVAKQDGVPAEEMSVSLSQSISEEASAKHSEGFAEAKSDHSTKSAVGAIKGTEVNTAEQTKNTHTEADQPKVGNELSQSKPITQSLSQVTLVNPDGAALDKSAAPGMAAASAMYVNPMANWTAVYQRAASYSSVNNPVIAYATANPVTTYAAANPITAYQTAVQPAYGTTYADASYGNTYQYNNTVYSSSYPTSYGYVQAANVGEDNHSYTSSIHSRYSQIYGSSLSRASGAQPYVAQAGPYPFGYGYRYMPMSAVDSSSILSKRSHASSVAGVPIATQGSQASINTQNSNNGAYDNNVNINNNNNTDAASTSSMVNDYSQYGTVSSWFSLAAGAGANASDGVGGEDRSGRVVDMAYYQYPNSTQVYAVPVVSGAAAPKIQTKAEEKKI